MPDSKITALTALTAADPANDMIPIVDVSDTPPASGNTKRISINNILACSPTATLASATITGDLTVDTSTLKVDSANNRVGVGTASPTRALSIVGSAVATYANINSGDNTSLVGLLLGGTSTPSAGQVIYDNTANSLAFFTSGATQMTLNSTGLGVGVSPAYQIHTRKDQAAFTTVAIDNHNAIAAGTGTQFLLIDGGTNAGWFRRNRDGTGNTDIGYKDTLRFRGQIAGTERTDMTVDTSGNVISNVTGTAPTLGTNNQMVFNLTSNTNLRISVRGTDGTTRTADITLA